MTEKQDQAGSIGNSLLIFLLGVAVGATVAILYAPAAGTETRAQIAEKATTIKDKASELSHQVADRAAEIREKVASRVRPGESAPVESLDATASEATPNGADTT
jgi:gas vesicle protein